MFGKIECGEHCQATVGGAAEPGRIIRVLYRADARLELPVEEVVEAFILGDIRLLKLIQADGIGLDE